MPGANQPAPHFEPPGPGTWTLDTAHFPQPATRFVIELFPEPARRGFKEATARYGLLMDHIEWGFVHGWAYLCPRPVRPPEEGATRDSWETLVASVPALGQRLAISARVFEDRRWRDDVAVWDGRTKPQLRREHRELQAVRPASLPTSNLLSHIERCRHNLRRAVYEHHRLNVAPVIPVGDFLAHAMEWTGRPPADLVGLVRGGGPPPVAAELTRLAEATREDAAAAAALSSDDEPLTILDLLVSRPGEVGRAAADYLDLVDCWSAGSGSDVGEPCLLELPHLLVETVRAAAQGGKPVRASEATAELVSEARASVPPARRVPFDALLAEARATHRLRDERVTYCDVWAYGLARRAILAAGRRLADIGAVEQPAHLVEAGYAEMRAVIDGATGPSGAELAARARDRQAATADHVPVVLGGPPSPPVPSDWLAAGAARTERAFRTYLRAMSADAAPERPSTVHGQPASPGTHEGRAVVVRGAHDLARIERGDVLVTASTTPALNPALLLVGAIVTDHGGLLSHAAIIAREFGIPAVVGTGDATTRIADGALVRVDGATGQAAVLG